jgi:hypothetical protein
MATDAVFRIRGVLKNAAGTALASTAVKAVRLQGKEVATSLLDSTQTTDPYFTATTDSSGVFLITCTHALQWTCPLTYKVLFPDGRYHMQNVGLNDSGRTFDLGTILVESAPPTVRDINITPLVQKNYMENGSTKKATAPAAVAATVNVSDSCLGDWHSTVVTLSALPVTVANTTGISFGSAQLLDFPEGKINVIGSYLRTKFTFGLTNAGNVTPIDGTMGGDVSIGTTASSDATLAGTDVDLLPSLSIDPISSGSALGLLASGAVFDGTSSAKDAFLNVIIDDADVADAASDILEVSGVWVINWVYIGD